MTEECRVLKGEKRQKYDNSNKKPYSNKTWSRNKSESSTNESKKELQAFIKKQVAKGVRKELNSISKKRKSDSDSDDELDLNALEKDVDDFNYNDMDNLKIDSGDESEVPT